MATKTLVKTFDDTSDAERAVHALHDAGFARDDLGWVARPRASNTETANAALEGAAVGGALGGLAGLLIGFAALAVPGIGPVVVAGPVVATIAGVGVGAAAGGIIDALVHLGVPHEEARDHAARLQHGGAIVTVTVDDDEEEARAREILDGRRPSKHPPLRWRAQPYTEEGRPSIQSIV